MSQIINCVDIATEIKAEVKREVEAIQSLGWGEPCLAVIIVGDDPASQVYVRNKEKVCEEVGIESLVFRFPEDATERQIKTKIRELNSNSWINGILIQLPLPAHINAQKVLDVIAPCKDVDGLAVDNQGLLALGRIEEAVIPCTPSGVMRVLNKIEGDLTGKRVVVIGRSNLFGKPMAQLCLNANATVTMAHSKTQRLATVTKQADIVICAVGQPKMFNAGYFTGGQTIIDVGINRDENGKLCGDCDLDSILQYRDDVNITPVPKGVGVLTTACLLQNVIKCYKLQH